MRGVIKFYQSTVGKKIIMGLTGALLFAFVLAHMVGNLKIYQGPDKFNAYAEFLRNVGYPALGHMQLLWMARVGMLAIAGLHILSAIQLYLISRKARDTDYKIKEDLCFSYASRTMRWGGITLLLFVIFHILHLTTGTVHSNFVHGEAYLNVIKGFSHWYVALVYALCMIPLGLHIYHGLWSATQTLALQHPKIKKWRRPFAAGIAILIAVCNISIPVSVFAGFLR
jgi:succinate dehydrogenase / fumarate reductase cytochrome b subunit